MQRFLGIDDTAAIEPAQIMQTRSTVRFTHLHPLSRSLRLARHRPEEATALARAATALAPKPLRVLWRRLFFTQPPAPDERLMLELRRRFKPEVQLELVDLSTFPKDVLHLPPQQNQLIAVALCYKC